MTIHSISGRSFQKPLLAAALPWLCLPASHAAQLVNWDIPTGTTSTALTNSVATGLNASPISLSGLSFTSASALWRTRGYSSTATRYITFSITAAAGNTVTLESLNFTANAQAGTGGAWTPPSLRLEHSTDPSFASGVVEAGSLVLGPNLAAGSTGTPVSADSTTFLANDLVINSGETYYFRLVGIGATGATTTSNMISYNSTSDMQIHGTVTSSAADLVWTGTDGANWNTTETNFTNAGNPATFANDDSVTIDTAGAIQIDSAGISAGTLTHSSASDTTTLAGGDLTVSSLNKTGAATLVLDSPLTLSTGLGVTQLAGGSLSMLSGSTLTTTSLNLSGGASLEIADGAVFTSTGVNTLGSGGGSISHATDLSLDKVANSILNNPLIKLGAGTLTFTNGLGTQNTGPADLDVLAGSVAFNGTTSTRQINVGGSNTINGSVSLNGPILMLHGSTVSGTGAITVNNSSSSITSRLNLGAVDVNLPITLASNLGLDSPSGNNLLRLNSSISGPGGLTKNGNGTAQLAGTNDYEGPNTVAAGVLRIGSGNAGTLGSGDVVISAAGASIQFNRADSVTIPNQISGVGNVIVSSTDGTTSLTAENTYTGKTTINGGRLGAIVITDGDQPSSIGQSSSDASNLLFNGGSLTYEGAQDTFTDRDFSLGTNGGGPSASGSGGLNFTSTNPITLSAPALSVLSRTINSTELTPGTVYQIVTLGDTDFTSVGAPSNTVGTQFTATGPGTGTGTATYGALIIGQTYRIWTSAPEFTSLGAASNDVGTVFIASATGIGLQASAGVVAYPYVRNFRMGGSGTGKNSLAAAIIDGTPEEIAEGSAILNTTSVSKNGTSVWAITGTNTYTGPTTVNSGTLLIEGDNSTATGIVTVMNGSFLGGSGTSGAAVAFANGAGVASKITNWTSQASTGNTQLTVASASIDGSLAVSLDTSEMINFTEEARSFILLKAGSVTGSLSPSTTVTAPGFTGTGSWTLNLAGGDLILNYNLASADPYTAWATANQLSGTSALATADPDHDGIQNLIEFIIGGNPNTATEAGKLPSATLSGNDMVFTYLRSQDASYLNPSVQYGSNLSTWTNAENGSNGVTIAVTPNFAPGIDQVHVTIPRTLASGAKFFARLNATSTFSN